MPYRILNGNEASQYLNLSRADLDRLVKNGEIPFEKRGGRAVFRGSEIDDWASKRILGANTRGLEEYQSRWPDTEQNLPQRTAFVSTLLPTGNISAEVPAKTRPSIVREMVTLANETGLLCDPAELITSLEAREQLCPTALPGGLALLHPRPFEPYRYIESFIALGRTSQPIYFGSADRQPTDLFFLICCQDDQLHLHTLARLCLMAQKTELLTQLREAADAEVMRQAILTAERQVLGISSEAQ